MLNKQVVKPHLAIFDLGSNSFHFMLVEQHRGFRKVIRTETITVQLARYLDQDGNLSQAGIDRAIKALLELSLYFKKYPDTQVIANATHTLRVAKNQTQALQQIYQQFPYQINVLSGQDEALGIYRGILLTNPINDKFVCLDIGGGSTELIASQQMKPLIYFSNQVGCVNMTHRFFSDGEISFDKFNAAVDFASNCFKENPLSAQLYNDFSNLQVAVGTSGTVKSCVQLTKELKINNGILNPQALDQIIALVMQHKTLDSLISSGYDLSGRGVIVGGLAVLKAIMNLIKPQKLIYSESALREGTLFMDVAYDDLTSVRNNGIQDFIESFHINKKFYKQVQGNFIKLLNDNFIDQSTEVRELLDVLVVIGLAGCYIGKNNSLAHSKYLSSQFTYFGFTRQQSQQVKAIFSGLVDKQLTIDDPIVKLLIPVTELSLKLFFNHLSNDYQTSNLEIKIDLEQAMIDLVVKELHDSLSHWDHLNDLRQNFRSSRYKLTLHNFN